MLYASDKTNQYVGKSENSFNIKATQMLSQPAFILEKKDITLSNM